MKVLLLWHLSSVSSMDGRKYIKLTRIVFLCYSIRLTVWRFFIAAEWKFLFVLLLRCCWCDDGDSSLLAVAVAGWLMYFNKNECWFVCKNSFKTQISDFSHIYALITSKHLFYLFHDFFKFFSLTCNSRHTMAKTTVISPKNFSPFLYTLFFCFVGFDSESENAEWIQGFCLHLFYFVATFFRMKQGIC